MGMEEIHTLEYVDREIGKLSQEEQWQIQSCINDLRDAMKKHPIDVQTVALARFSLEFRMLVEPYYREMKDE